MKLDDITFDNYLEGLVLFSLTLPTESRFYQREGNVVRDLLLDLADCVRASTMAIRERKEAFSNSHATTTPRTTTPARAEG